MTDLKERKAYSQTDLMNNYNLPPEGQYYYPPTIPQKPKVEIGGKDTLFAWLSILVGFIIARAVPTIQNTLGTVLTVCLLFAFGIAFSKINGTPVTKRSYILMATVILFSMGYITSANRAIQRYALFPIILFAFLYWVYASNGLSDGIFGKNFPGHALMGIFVQPARHLIHFFPALILKEKSTKTSKIVHSLLWILAGLGCAVIPTLLIIALLSYDKEFTDLLKGIFTFSLDDIAELMIDLVIGFAAATVLFGSLFGAKLGRKEYGGKPREPMGIKVKHLHRALVCATVTPILGVYVLFFISQWSYYVSAFTGTLHGDLTYAEYARSGFFQLCWVCAINALLLLLFNILIKKSEKKNDPLKRIYSTVISVFTLVLIATALSKMILYIKSFGLTQRRVYASWFIVLLAVIFIVVLLGQFIRRLPLVTVIAVTVTVFLGLIIIPNVDGAIASYNVKAYLSGDLNTVDIASVHSLGVSGVPALVELHDELSSRESPTEDEKLLLYMTRNSLYTTKKYVIDKTPDSIFSFNIPTARARALIEEIEWLLESPA